MFKTVPQVYRDCLRLIEHIGGRSRKADLMKQLVSQQFRVHANEKDEKKIEDLKRNAMAGLANYLTIESLSKLEKTPGTEGGGGGIIKNPLTPPPSKPSSQAASASSPRVAVDTASLPSAATMVPHMHAPVSDRVLELQKQIRARKAARDAAAAAEAAKKQ